MRLLRRLIIPAAVAALWACDHTSPFSAAIYTSTTPLSPGNPAQLTFNTGVDTRASWLPDGSGFLYTQEQIGRSDRDRCLVLMPANGGAVSRTICDQSNSGGDSLDDFESAAVSADGRIVYARTSMIAGIGHAGPDNAALVLAPLGTPLAATVLQIIPYFGPANRSVDMVSDVHWVGPSTIVFLSEQWNYPPACPTCINVDTVRSGLDVQRIDLGASPVLSLVPSTDQATSVTTGGPDTIFYTLAGDPGVHRRVLSSNADTVVYTFGGPPTDVTVAGTRLAAVVGTILHLADFLSLSDSAISSPATHAYRPSLSPDGKRLVAELAQVDSTGAESPTDIWLWRLP